MTTEGLQDLTVPNPDNVLALLENFRRSKIMFAAVKLGVFDALQEQASTAVDLAKKLDCDPDAMARLLNACVGLELLTKSDEQFSNTGAAKPI